LPSVLPRALHGEGGPHSPLKSLQPSGLRHFHAAVPRSLIEGVGCVAYLRKPFSAKSLVQAIEEADRHNQTALSTFD
jgi:CheY-like chemotaxis protein